MFLEWVFSEQNKEQRAKERLEDTSSIDSYFLDLHE